MNINWSIVISILQPIIAGIVIFFLGYWFIERPKKMEKHDNYRIELMNDIYSIADQCFNGQGFPQSQWANFRGSSVIRFNLTKKEASEIFDSFYEEVNNLLVDIKSEETDPKFEASLSALLKIEELIKNHKINY